MHMGDSVSSDLGPAPSGWRLGALFVLLALALLAGGYTYYQREADSQRRASVENLRAVGELKVLQIERLRQDMLSDAARAADSPFFTEAAAAWLAGRADGDPRARLRRRLQADLEGADYTDALLLDGAGYPALAARGEPAPLDPAARAAVERAAATQAPVISGLYRVASGRVYLDTVAPMLADDGRRVGFLTLRSDAARELLPLLQTWPTPSPTAETLIVRRDGDSVLFLNELRHRKGTALILRIPLTQASLPAVRAVEGRTGTFEGVDYRGRHVVADLRPIPGSQWFMVTKVDEAEIAALARRRAGIIAAFTALLIVAAGATVAHLYRRRQLRLYRGLYRAERHEREAQQALRASEEHLRTTMDRMMEGCQIIAPDWRYIYVNPTAAAQGRKTPQELVGRTMMEAFPGIEKTEMFAVLKRCMEDGTPAQIENEFEYGDGTSRWFDLRMQPVPEGIFVLSLDITERKLAQGQIESTLADLERSNRELEQFAYVACHDLQEPLRMVASYTQLLSERYGDRLDGDAQDFIRFAVEGANRMQGLIHDLLSYSRITTRGRPLETVDPEEVLAEVRDNLRVAVEESGAVITNDDLPLVMADRSQLRSLLQNLLANAIKFHRDGHPPRVHVWAEADGPFWSFSVKDNGIGIEPKYFDRIFTIFQRLHGREKYRGTGIGLALCKRIVERHGGQHLGGEHARGGNGLPLHPPGGLQERSAGVSTASERKPVEILLVEDNEGDARLTTEALRDSGSANKAHARARRGGGRGLPAQAGPLRGCPRARTSSCWT